jgi:hypothetical protein
MAIPKGIVSRARAALSALVAPDAPTITPPATTPPAPPATTAVPPAKPTAPAARPAALPPLATRLAAQKNLEARFAPERQRVLQQVQQRATSVVAARRNWTAAGKVIATDLTAVAQLKDLTIAGHGDQAEFVLPSLPDRFNEAQPRPVPGKRSTILRHSLDRFEALDRDGDGTTRRPRRS